MPQDPPAPSSPLLKAALVLGVLYVLTVGGAGMACFAYMVVSGPRGCGALGRALMVLWGLLGVAAVGSLVAAAVAIGRLALGCGAKLLLAGLYAVAVLGTFVPVAFGLLVAFNC